MEITKNCPFCGGAGELKTEMEAAVYSTDTCKNVFVKCQECGARSKKIYKKTLAEMTSYTVSDFRNNPILMAKVEDQYEKYVKGIELLAVNEWEGRYVPE